MEPNVVVKKYNTKQRYCEICRVTKKYSTFTTDENICTKCRNAKVKQEESLKANANELQQQLDELKRENDQLKHDVQLTGTNYSAQVALLDAAQNEKKASEEKLQAEIDNLQAERALFKMQKEKDAMEIDQLRIQMGQIQARNIQFQNEISWSQSDRVRRLIDDETVNQLNLLLKEKDEEIRALQVEIQKLKEKEVRYVAQTRSFINDGPRPMTAPQIVSVGVVADLTQKFENLKPESPPRHPLPPFIWGEAGCSPPRIHLTKTKECMSCVKTLPADQFDKFKHKCRECLQLGL